MALLRLLLIALVVWIAFTLARAYFRKRQNTQNRPGAYAPTVQCRYCGVHLPKHEAYEHSSGYYCSQDHYDKAKARH